MDLEGKTAIIHTIGGILFGLLANYIYTAGLGTLSGIVTLLFLFVGLIITGHITAMIVGKGSLSQKQWLGSGGVSYFFTSVVFWVLVYNGVLL
ncbi:EMC6-like membrane protein [Methanothermococcus okinawensis]|uniref:Uncharacterized protein n=1 Tax=Methanothermococcus okinawensis (strain DSM 14208 / JCM 11175 / IH1) TaxID=647113 RepID=F8AMB5_METOI|nr:DUF5379 family protein [Methanothermococcus okinawensis]AEH06805.1 hypothetical protein Metok_0828 [Methanothermococcus okinawensis IH1]